jgi:hypothetical protein
MTILDLKDKLYTSTEVANILGVSLRSVYRYLEEDKLNADVKTATGRHRFSRQNIMDFLYPDRSNEVKKVQNSVPSKRNITGDVKKPEIFPETDNTQSYDIKEQRDDIDTDKNDINFVDSPVVEDKKQNVQDTQNDAESEPVDWLARFRAAAEKYRTEQTANDMKSDDVSITNVEPKATPVENTIDSFIPKYEEVYVEEKSEYYYLSGIGGLKDIAQGLDKAAKKASVDYVFTMDAGLSLFKPIRPFSVIHAYVRPQDREYFEKALKLTEVSKNSAQLCLIMSDEKELYSSKAEMYGLSVVSKERLKLDLISNGEKDLVSELDNLA